MRNFICKIMSCYVPGRNYCLWHSQEVDKLSECGQYGFTSKELDESAERLKKYQLGSVEALKDLGVKI